MRLDLHIHSTASDGVCSPEDVVDRAINGGLDVIALTDHDTAAGVPFAQTAVASRFLQVIAGIEVSSTYDGGDVHILGFGVDVASVALERHRKKSLERRIQRIREILGKLSLQGLPLLYADVEAELDFEDVAPARPHLARALVKKGHAVSVRDAFARLIGDDCTAFVPTGVAEPLEAIQVVLDAGGVPVWAHPPVNLLEPLLEELVDGGLMGLEVLRPRNSASLVTRLQKDADTYGLVISGGSDWHGPHGKRELGDFHVSPNEIEPLMEKLGL